MKNTVLLVCFLLFQSASILGFSGYDPADGHLAVHFIDVGQGDSIFIQTSSHHVLIDGGDRGHTVPNYLKARGADTIHIMIGTHAHADHIGGLINVMQELTVEEVIDPAVVHTTRTFEDYLTMIDQKDIIFTEGRAGMQRTIGNGKQLEILHPEHPSSNHLNNSSIVVKVTYGDISFLFTGDAEAAAEQEMLTRSGQSLTSTVLKVGHHGSRTSTTPAFLSAVDPEVSVITAGAGNRYGHPHEEVLTRLSHNQVDIYRTDIHGNIIVSTDGANYHIDVHEPYAYEGEGMDSYGININTASAGRLQDIIHISENRAQQLIALRPFQSLKDLDRISGIGPARIQDIEDQGLAFVE